LRRARTCQARAENFAFCLKKTYAAAAGARAAGRLVYASRNSRADRRGVGVTGLMSFEGLSLAFEQFVNNRVVTVSHLQHDVETAQHSLDRIVATRTTADGDITKLTAEITRSTTR
jgi:hypothetical protein